jgi:peptide/nickel transport system permease protein
VTTIVLHRLVRFAVVLVGVSVVTFAILHASGDPVALMMPDAADAERAGLRKTLGLEDPLAVQFLRFVTDVARGRFGESFYHRAPALGLVVERMPITLTLSVSAMVLALAASLPAGIVSALRHGSSTDHAVTTLAFLGSSMPVFWTGIMLVLLFSVHWRLLPVSGWASWSAMVLPVLTLGVALIPVQLRIVRSSMLDVIGLDYVRTARAKGLSERAVVWRHALRNAALPLVTVVGLQFGFLLGGAVIIETVFAIPGVGRLIVSAIGQLDFPVVQAGVLFTSILFVASNLLVDLSYGFIDLRIRRDG